MVIPPCNPNHSHIRQIRHISKEDRSLPKKSGHHCFHSLPKGFQLASCLCWFCTSKTPYSKTGAHFRTLASVPSDNVPLTLASPCWRRCICWVHWHAGTSWQALSADWRWALAPWEREEKRGYLTAFSGRHGHSTNYAVNLSMYALMFALDKNTDGPTVSIRFLSTYFTQMHSKCAVFKLRICFTNAKSLARVLKHCARVLYAWRNKATGSVLYCTVCTKEARIYYKQIFSLIPMHSGVEVVALRHWRWC